MKRILSKLPWLVTTACLVGFLVYGFWPRPVGVDIVQPSRGILEVTVDDDGETRIREKYRVAAPVAGKLLRIDLEPGDSVVQGETELARLEPSSPSLLDARTRAESEAKVSATQAMMERTQEALQYAKEALELAQHEFVRAKSLSTTSAISQAEFDVAEHRERMARSEVRSAEFAVTVAKYEYEQAQAALTYVDSGDTGSSSTTFRIRSPISGLVLNVFHEDANVVAAGTQLLELGDPRDMEMKIDVLSTDAVRIRSGQRVYIEHWGGPNTLDGVVSSIEPAAFLKISALGVEEKRVNVLVDFLDPWPSRRTLGDGFRVEVRIVVESTENNAIIVPSGALFRDGDQWQTYCITNGRAELRAVQVGLSNEMETQILDGISDDDQLIFHPTDKIQPGTLVKPQ